jgi:hypothetical protein
LDLDFKRIRPNVGLIGKTGSGKTRAMMARAADYLSAGQSVMILSASREYLDWCHTQGGTYATLYAGKQVDIQAYGQAALIVSEFDEEVSQPGVNQAWLRAQLMSHRTRGALLAVDQISYIFAVYPQSAAQLNAHCVNEGDFCLVGQHEDDFELINEELSQVSISSMRTLEAEHGQPLRLVKESAPLWEAV